jgi:hypothetical protein
MLCAKLVAEQKPDSNRDTMKTAVVCFMDKRFHYPCFLMLSIKARLYYEKYGSSERKTLTRTGDCGRA